jgi:hypothetical protein
MKSLRPFLSSRKTLLGAVLTAAGAVGALSKHLIILADGGAISPEIIFTAVAALGSALTGFFAKDADKTGVQK